MDRTMTWRAIVTFCGVCAAGLWGCGGGGDGGGTEFHRVIPPGYMEVSVTASAVGSGGVVHNLLTSADLGLLKDATGSGAGDGSGVDGPTSITDTAAVTCTFDAGGPSNQTTTENYTVRLSTDSACTNDNECITCTITGSGTSACSLVCSGVVPSSAAAASDTFPVALTFTSALASDMPDPYGTVRFDATTADAASPYFDLSSALPSGPGTGDCDGVSAEELDITTGEYTAGTWMPGGDTQGAYRHGYKIMDVGGAASSTCTVTHMFQGTAVLTNLATGGTTATNDMGTVTMKATICDDRDEAAPLHSSASCLPVGGE